VFVIRSRALRASRLLPFVAAALFTACPPNPEILPPQGLSATSVSTSRIELSWSAPASGESPTGYRVFRDGQVWTDTAGLTSADDGLAPSTHHCYQVASVASNGDVSEKTAEVCATTASTPQATQFTLTVQRAGSGAAAGKVTGPGIDCGADCSEKVNSGTGSTLTAIAQAGVTFTSWSGCDGQNGNVCTVSLTRDRTVVATFTTVTQTGDTSPPTTPGRPDLTPSVNSIHVSFAPSTDNVGVTGYRVYRGGVLTRTVTQASFDDGGLEAETTYCYYLVAVDAAGNASPSSAQECATTNSPPPVPRAPTGVLLSDLTATGGRLSWTPGSTDQTGFEVGFCEGLITSDSNGGRWCELAASRKAVARLAATDRSYVFTGLVTGRTYDIYVMAFNANGVSQAPLKQLVPKAQVVLRISNNSSYDIVQLTIGGQAQLAYPQLIAAGSTRDFALPGSGASLVTYQMKLGFYTSSGAVDDWWDANGSISVSPGINNLPIYNASIAWVLTGGRSGGRNWTGEYYCYTCTSLVNQATLWFGPDGTWKLYDNGKQIGSGSVSLVSWPRYASIVEFKLCPTCGVIQLAYPFGEFKYRNGPADWPVISYVAQ
jgi:hypothetical protein